MLPPKAPVPVLANWNGASPVLVRFNGPLAPGILDPTNWAVHHRNLRYTVLTAYILQDPFNRLVRLTVGFSAAFPAPDSVDYQPPPFDVTSVKGPVPADAFLGFPLDP